MWNSDFYAAQPHRAGGPASASLSSTVAPPNRPPPVGVLSPNLARPISVRELAQSRVPAVAPPRTSTSSMSFDSGAHPLPSPRTSGGFAGFGVPKAPVVYAATSGVMTSGASSHPGHASQSELSTYGEASDLTSLAYRSLDNLSSNDLYNYASHLQDAAKNYSNHLSEAYTKRDLYRSQVADLKRELQEKYLQTDLLRRDRERSDDAIDKLREDNAQLRQQLAVAEGERRNMSAKLSLHSGADPSLVIRAYQAQLAQKDAQLRDAMQRLASQSADGRDEQQEEDEQQRHEVEERVRKEVGEASASAVAAATAALQAELDTLHERNSALEAQLEAETKQCTEAQAHAAAERTELLDIVATLKREKTEMQDNEDALIAALTLRAPIAKTDFEALQTSYAEMQSALAKAESTVAALREQQNAAAARDGYVEVLQQSLTTSQAERQELTEKNGHLQALVENLQREVQLADTAGQLRQQQLEAVIAGGDEHALQAERAQEAQQAQMSQEVAALQARCEAAEGELQRLRAEAQNVHRGQQQEPRTQPTRSSDHHDPIEGFNVERERSELQAEVETLRSARDELVANRDALIGEVRDLEERRQAARNDLVQQATNVVSESVTVAAASAAETGEASQQSDGEAGEDVATLLAAQQCIAALQRDLEAVNAAHARVEADTQVQFDALETTLAEQSEALLRAAEQQRQTEEDARLSKEAAEAKESHLEEVIQALKEELEFTQAQGKELLQLEASYKERYAAQLRQTEQLRERIVELEKRASGMLEHEQTPPSTQPAHASLRASTSVELQNEKENAATLTAALARLAEQLTEAQDNVQGLQAERQRHIEELVRAHRVITALEDRNTAYERGSRAANTSTAGDNGVAARVESLNNETVTSLREAECSVPERVAALNTERGVASQELTQLHERLIAMSMRQEDTEAEHRRLQQQLKGTEEELRTAKAALDRVVEEAATAAQHANALAAVNTDLESERARQATERDALHQRVSEAEGELRVATVALEKMAGELAGADERVESLSVVNSYLEVEVSRLRADAAAAQNSAATLIAERDSHAGTDAEHQIKLSAAESHISALVSERNAAQQQLKGTEEELRTAKAALDRVVEEAATATQQANAVAASSARLEVEKEQLATERDGVHQQVKLLEDQLRVAKAALEKMAGELASSVERADGSAEEESGLKSEVSRLKADLSDSQSVVATLSAERDSHAGKEAELATKLSAAETSMRAAVADRDVTLERAKSLEEELRTAKAALDRVVEEAATAAQHANALVAVNTDLESERARQATERDALHQRVSEAEGELRVATVALEKMAGELASSVERVESLSVVNSNLEVEVSRLKADLTAAQNSLSSLGAERDGHKSANTTTEAKRNGEELLRISTHSDYHRSQQQLKGAETELLVAKAALEKMAGELASSVERVESLSVVNSNLEVEVSRLRADAAAAQNSAATLIAERDSHAGTDAELQIKLSAAESHISALVSERNAAQQQLKGTEEELRTAKAALDRVVEEAATAAQQANAVAASSARLEVEKQQLTTGRDGVHQQVKLLEDQLRVAKAALEKMAGELASSVERADGSAEEESGLKSEVSRLKADLSDSQSVVATLSAERDSHAGKEAELATKLSAAETSMRSAVADRDVTLERAKSLEEELRTAKAALDRVVEEAATAAQHANPLVAVNTDLESERARQATQRDALHQRVSEAEGELRVAKAALEKMAGELASSVERVESLSVVNSYLEVEVSRLRADAAAAQNSAATLIAERDSHAGTDAELQIKLSATESHISALVSERNAAQQQLKGTEEELRTAKAALDRVVEEAANATQQANALAAVNTELETVRAQQATERDALHRRVSEAEEKVRTATAALEKMAAELAGAAERIESFSVINSNLEVEVARGKADLLLAESTVATLSAERDSHVSASAELATKLSAAETSMRTAVADRDATLERVKSAEEEVRIVKAALERMAGELAGSAERVDSLTAANSGLEAEKVKQEAGMQQALRQVVELSSRISIEEEHSAEAATAAKELIASQTARIAELERINARVKEQLSVARGAVGSLAEGCTTTATQTAGLTCQVERETELRKSAEAVQSALRDELRIAQAAVDQLSEDLETQRANEAALQAAHTAQEEAFAVLSAQHDSERAELAEVRRRGEELQDLLNTTLDELAHAKALVKELNDNAADLHSERAALSEEVATLRVALETEVVERKDLEERLTAANAGLEKTATLYNERILEDDRLQEELSAVLKAFEAQKDQVKVGIRAVVQMSEGVSKAVAAAMRPATTTMHAIAEAAASAKDTAGTESKLTQSTPDTSAFVSTINSALAPWSAALEWVQKMDQCLRALERSEVEAEDRTNASFTAASSTNSFSPASPSTSSRASPAQSHTTVVAGTRSALIDFAEVQATSMTHLQQLRHALAERDNEIILLKSALNTLAGVTVEEKERVDHLIGAIENVKSNVSLAEREFDEQLRLRSEAITADLVVARRAEERATDARLRAETQLASVQEELKESQSALEKLQEEHRRLVRETDRLSRYSVRMTDAAVRGRAGVSGSVTPASTAITGEAMASPYTVTPAALEAVEQSHLLQVSTLQHDLMLSRRQTRELEGREAILRQAYTALEQEVSDLRADAAEAMELREAIATVRADYAALEEEHHQLTRLNEAAGGGTLSELKQLRQQLRVREAELEEQKTRVRESVLVKSTSELEVARRQGGLRETLSGITTQLAATQAQYSGGRTPRERATTTLGGGTRADPASAQEVLNSRIEHLEAILRERDTAMEKMKADLLAARVALGEVEDRLAEKTAALDRASELIAQYADTIEALRTAGMPTATRPTTPRRNTADGHLTSRLPQASIPPATPLSVLKSSEGEAAAPLPSPAPRMPNLDELVEEEEADSSDKEEEEGEATSASPASVRRRTETAGEESRRGGHRPAKQQSTPSGETPPASRTPRASSRSGNATPSRKRGRKPAAK